MAELFVIGGGASGLVSAITAARAGVRVTILEQNKKIGRKLLSSGNGKCNLTNTGDPVKAYRGSDPSFAYAVLDRYGVDDTLAFFRALGLMTVSHGGWIYPYSEQSRTVLALLMRETERLGIRIRTDTKALGITLSDGGFTIKTRSWDYEAAAVILATGSPASEVQGASADMAAFADSLGLKTIPYGPALTSLSSDDPRITRWGSVRAYAAVTLYIDGEKVLKSGGQIQLTDRGVSGIPVFQVSRFASEALDSSKRVSLEIDFMPDVSEGALTDFFESRADDLKDALTGLFPDKLIDVLGMYAHSPARLADTVKHFRLKITGSGSIKHSQVCRGGVLTDQIDPDTCGTSAHPGIFLCGEGLDIDGDCGGWNLQFAWSTGHLAGQAAASYIKEKEAAEGEA